MHKFTIVALSLFSMQTTMVSAASLDNISLNSEAEAYPSIKNVNVIKNSTSEKKHMRGFSNGNWGNGGWTNGNWGNGGWTNGNWGNGGWTNGNWGNGGWTNGNWGNGNEVRSSASQIFALNGLLSLTNAVSSFNHCLSTTDCYITGQSVRNTLNITNSTQTSFKHCSTYGCQTIQEIGFSKNEWEKVAKIFNTPALNAKQEREQLSQAIGLMEQITGPKTGTVNDGAKSDLYTFDATGELDCIDEANNTTTYLSLLDQAGFIKYHNIGEIILRGGIAEMMLLHNTATVIEKHQQVAYALDTWYRANGTKADIVPLNEWKAGWKPNN